MKPISLMLLLGLTALGARADSILITFDPLTLTGYAGAPIVQDVTGTLENTGGTQIDPVAFSIEPTVAASGLVVDGSVFNAPDEELAPNQTSSDFVLFAIDFSEATIGDYAGNYVVYDDEDNVADIGQFEVVVEAEPAYEPGSLVLTSLAFGIAAGYHHRLRLGLLRGLVNLS